MQALSFFRTNSPTRRHAALLPTLLAGFLLASAYPVAAAVIPYTNDFSGIGQNVAFPVESPDAEWTVTGGSYAFTTTNTSIAPSTSSISITGAQGASFTMETQFTLTGTGTVNNNGATLGLGLFGANTTFTGSAGSAYYLADWQVENGNNNPGGLRILALGDTTGFTNSGTTFVDANPGVSNLAIVPGTTYTLRLVGTYSGSTLNMTLGIFDATGTIQIGGSATASDTSPLTGTNFGYRNRIGLGGGTFSTNFDNFSIVPEPAAAILLGLGSTALLILRRRNKTSSGGS